MARWYVLIGPYDAKPATLETQLALREDGYEGVRVARLRDRTELPEPAASEGPAWAMGYTDTTGTVVVECCDRTFESKSDAEEYLSHAPMGLWYWEGAIRAWQCREGDYDSEAVGKFAPTTARCVNLGEAPGDEEPSAPAQTERLAKVGAEPTDDDLLDLFERSEYASGDTRAARRALYNLGREHGRAERDAEKATEPCDKCGSEEPTERHLCAICAIVERPDRHEAPPETADRAAEDWQPIATAPTDGTEVLMCRGKWFSVGRIEGEVCHWGYLALPTHWRPLPAPPGGGR